MRKTTKELDKLSISELENLKAEIENLILEKKLKEKEGKKLYRQEPMQCNKPNCKCKRGKLHGPYWYSYQYENGTIKRKYVGRELPANVKKFRTEKVKLGVVETEQILIDI